MIPIDKDSQYYPKDERPQSLPPTSQNANKQASPSNNNELQRNGSQSMSAMPVLSPEEENKKDIDEFLGKIDSTLAETKKYVAKSQHSFE